MTSFAFSKLKKFIQFYISKLADMIDFFWHTKKRSFLHQIGDFIGNKFIFSTHLTVDNENMEHVYQRSLSYAHISILSHFEHASDNSQLSIIYCDINWMSCLEMMNCRTG